MENVESGWGKVAGTWILSLFAFAGLAISLSSEAAAQSNKIPGMSLGNFNVSKNGAAGYSIPIITPPSFGPGPKLTLVYDSQSQSGLLGVSWSLVGLPVVHRCSQTIAQDNFKGSINFDANDRYCLDGARLMAINGAYGADNTEYRTELDTFVKVVSKGTAGNGPEYFIVKNKAGDTMVFGGPAGLPSPNSRVEAQGKTSVRVWALSRITDVNNNYLTISYDDKDPINGDYRPTRIDYTANDGQAVASQRSVTFTYEDRTDKTPMFIAGSMVKIMKRLSKIQTYAPNPSLPPGSQPVLVREYRLTYEIGTATQRSRLKNVTECGWNTNTSTYDCLPPNVFNWQDAQNGFINPSPPPWATTLWGNDATLNFVGDFNGDGKMDIVSWLDSTHVKVHFSTGTGFDPQTWTHALSGGLNGSLNYVGDFDGDGRADIMGCPNTAVTTSVKVHLSKGDHFDIQTWTSSLNICSTIPISVGDFNGDGQSDILLISSTSGVVLLSTGNDFTDYQSNWRFDANGAGLNYIGDFNGDGKLDVLVKKDGGDQLYLNTGSGFTLQIWPANINTSGYNFVGDFNGDGLSDLVSKNGGSSYVHLSTGTGFNIVTSTTAINSR